MKYWYQSKWSPIAMALAPLSAVVRVIAFSKRTLRVRKSYSVPVIVVGNISVGGTGKTPTIIWLANFLTEQGYRVGVVSRGYGAKPDRPYPVEVSASDSALVVGDEPALIFKKTSTRIVIDPNRHRAVEYLCQANSNKPNVIISDDGMQHYRMGRDIEMLMIDPLRGFGNHKVLPAGPLREPTSRVNSVEFILAKQNGAFLPKQHVYLATVKKIAPINSKKSNLKVQSVKLISAIGNIESFVQTVNDLGYSIVDQIEFRDHSVLPIDILSDTSMPIVVTEKDYIKMNSPSSHIYYVPFEINYDDSLKKKILRRLKEVIDEKSNSNTRSL